jgi:hypothetical protein
MKFSFFVKQMIRSGVGLPALKYFSRWQASMHPDANSVKDEQPWITFKAIDFLSKNLNTHQSYLNMEVEVLHCFLLNVHQKLKQ